MATLRPWRERAPGDDDVVIAVEACVAGQPEVSAPATVVPGGAAVGTVTTTGANATHLAGARVVVGPFDPCGECEVCRRGIVAACGARVERGRTVDGAMSSHVLANARWVTRVDGDLAVPGPAAALLGREVALAYALYVAGNIGPGDPVAIVGSGAVARFARAIVEAKSAKVMDITEVAGSATPVAILETSGADTTRRIALAAVGPGARIAMLATTAASAVVDVARVLPLGASMVAVAGAHPDLTTELAAMVVKGELDLAAGAHVIGPDSLADLGTVVDKATLLDKVPVLALT